MHKIISNPGNKHTIFVLIPSKQMPRCNVIAESDVEKNCVDTISTAYSIRSKPCVAHAVQNETISVIVRETNTLLLWKQYLIK